MGPSGVEVAQRVFGEDVVQVPLGEDDQVIEAVVAKNSFARLSRRGLKGAMTKNPFSGQRAGAGRREHTASAGAIHR